MLEHAFFDDATANQVGPCDSCPAAPRCSRFKLACLAFAAFVDTGLEQHWIGESRVPSRGVFYRVFIARRNSASEADTSVATPPPAPVVRLGSRAEQRAAMALRWALIAASKQPGRSRREVAARCGITMDRLHADEKAMRLARQKGVPPGKTKTGGTQDAARPA